MEAFNHHFTSIGSKLAEKIEDRDGNDCLQNISAETSSDMSFSTIDENYVINAINRLKNIKSSGPDKVSITIGKDVKDLIAKSLKIIYNNSIIHGIFPDIWKLAKVTPISKSGSKSDNYRPISVIYFFEDARKTGA